LKRWSASSSMLKKHGLGVAVRSCCVPRPLMIALSLLPALMPAMSSMVAAQGRPVVTVSRDDFQIDIGGEFDAVLIPPSLKKECPAGRVLASNDWQITATGAPLSTGIADGTGNSVVIGRDFNGGNRIAAKFDAVPNPDDHGWGTADHDLVSLPDGTILLLAGVFLKAPISPKPAWFETTFRGTFGPGARSGVSVWRSVDCGVSFKWVSDLDSADPAFENGDCGLPQFRLDANRNQVEMPPWDMGGTDGQKALVRVGGRDGDVWLVHQCVGYHAKADTPSFELDPNNPVRLALIFRSRDRGANWEIAARLSPTLPYVNQVWRGDFALRRRTAALIDGRFSGLWLAPFSGKMLPAMFAPPRLDPFPDQEAGYSEDFGKQGEALTQCTTAICGLIRLGLRTNFLVHTVMVPFGSQRLVLSAYPSIISRGSGQGATNGYIVYVLDVSTGDAVQLDPVLPESGNEHESFIAFLTMASDGRGSALLYWYDVDARSGETRIQGRHISPRAQTDDFDISRSRGVGRSWSYTDNDWYGDYHEAGGFSFLLPPTLFARTGTLRHIYFPAWADAQRQSHTARVIVDEPAAGRPIDAILSQLRD
jgi:hypothetical protein